MNSSHIKLMDKHISHIILLGLMLLCTSQSLAQLYGVNKGRLWGFINAQGEVVVPLQYDYVFPQLDSLIANRGVHVVEKDGKVGVFEEGKGEIISPSYERIIIKTADSTDIWLQTEQEFKKGLLELNGKQLLANKYDSIYSKDGLHFRVFQEGKSGAWDRKLGWITDLGYDSVRFQMPFGWLAWKGNTTDRFDDTGKRLSETLPYRLKLLGDSLLTYQTESSGNKMGLASAQGKLFSDAIYKEVHMVGPYIKTVLSGTSIFGNFQCGLWSPSGEQLFGDTLQSIMLDRMGKIWVRSAGLWGVADSTGEWIFPPSFTNAGAFTGPVAQVNGGGGFGLINQYGDLLADCRYYNIEVFPEAAILYHPEGKEQVAYYKDGKPDFRKRLIVQDNFRQPTDTAKMARRGRTIETLGSVGWSYNRSLGVWGLRGDDGRWRISPRYDHVKLVPDKGISLVLQRPHANVVLYGLVDHRKGRVLRKPSVSMIFMQDFETGNVARVQYGSGAFGLIDVRGRMRRLTKANYIGPFVEGMARMMHNSHINAEVVKILGEEPRVPRQKYQARWSYLSQSGKEESPKSYQFIAPFQKGIGVFKKRQKLGRCQSPVGYDRLSGS